MRPADAQVCHQIPGRFRVKVPGRRRDEVYFLNARECILRCEGVISVATQPLTASLLIRHAGNIGAIVRYAQEQGLFRLVGNAAPTPVQAGLPGARQSLDDDSPPLESGALNVDGVLVAMLAGLGIYQALRGDIMAPAITLFWYAYVTFRSRQANETRGTTRQCDLAPAPIGVPGP